METLRSCSVPDCKRRYLAKGLCKFHYQRKRQGVEFDRPYRLCTGEHNSNWKGGVIEDGHGRILVYKPDHPFSSMFKTHVYRYRLVMEDHLGRYLRPEEIVHHKNGDHSDYRVENLEIMSQSEHIRIHLHGGTK